MASRRQLDQFHGMNRVALTKMTALIDVVIFVSVHGKDPTPTDISKELRRYVTKLAGDFPNRNTTDPRQLHQAEKWMSENLSQGDPSRHKVSRQAYKAAGETFATLELELRGQAEPENIIVIGAHYGSVPGRPAANDNGSGVAALLYLAKQFITMPKPKRTLRFVAFVNEEPPHFQTDAMGSLVYAKRCQARGEKITAMLSLETLGYYTDAKKSQKYPPLLSAVYPSEGNFLAFVGNPSSKFSQKEISETQHASCGKRSLSCRTPRDRVVRPLVLLASGLPGSHDHGHRAFPLPALSLA
ncbi:MAG: hypothetical protein ACI9DF_000495 [Verrucomicrobiales bacterium]